MRIRLICLQVCVAIWCLGASAPARAEPEWIIGQPSDELRMTDLSFGTTLDGGYGFGITTGLQMGIPIVDGGLIRPINDSFYLEPGLFMSARLHRDGENYYWAVPEIGPRWNFHLTPVWDAFASLKLGWAIGDEGDFWIRGTVGMQWWFARQWALRVETTAGALIDAGVYLGISYRFM
jgi:hypothetical protein